MYLFSNILGVFVFDDKISLVEEVLFKGAAQAAEKESNLKKLTDKYQSLEEPDQAISARILLYFKNNRFSNDFYKKNIEITKAAMKNSATDDILLIQSINSIEELDKAINLLAKRLREWYELYNPETSKAIEQHEKFIEVILEKDKKELLEELKINVNDSIGADLSQDDLKPMMALAQQIYDLCQLRKSQFDYISTLMDELCPNLKAVCGALIGAKLIEHAGSLKRLSEMPASTIQILGAEHALFRHMKTGAKAPRHGIIVNHPSIAKAPNKLHGKIARALADKISIACKVDYFNGKFIGDKLKQELEKRIEEILK